MAGDFIEIGMSLCTSWFEKPGPYSFFCNNYQIYLEVHFFSYFCAKGKEGYIYSVYHFFLIYMYIIIPLNKICRTFSVDNQLFKSSFWAGTPVHFSSFGETVFL